MHRVKRQPETMKKAPTPFRVVIAAALCLTVIGVPSAVLARSQKQAEKDLLDRFEARGDMGARFMSGYIEDLQRRQQRFAEERLGDSPSAAEIRHGLSALGLELAVVLEDGRFVSGYPFNRELVGADLAAKYRHLALATNGVPATSLVVPSAAEGIPIVGFAAPYGDPTENRVISGGYPVADSPIGSTYLDSVSPLQGAHTYLVDDAGSIVAMSQPKSSAPGLLSEHSPGLARALETEASRGSFQEGSEPFLFATERVSGAPWRLVTVVPERALFAPVRGEDQWIPWVLLAAALLCIGATVLTLRRLHDGRRELQRANAALEDSSAELQRSTERYRVLVERLPVVVYTAEPGEAGSWMYVSPTIKDLFDIDPAEWAASPSAWIEWVHPDDRAGVMATEATILRPGESMSIEYRIRDGHGKTRWVQDDFTMITDPSSGKLICQGMIADVTEQRELEHQLMQSQKMEAVGRLAGGVAHDFNNLLAVVLNYAQFVSDDLGPDDPRSDDVKEIITAAERGARLVHQLLAFSRKGVRTLQTIDVNDTVNTMQNMLRTLVGEDIALRFEPEPSLPHVEVDPAQLEQVVVNLVVNARDAMSTGGSLVMTTSRFVATDEVTEKHSGMSPGEYVSLAVSDNGAGMSREIMEQVFEPFFTTKGVGKGTGLGLSTVYGVVRQADGYVWLESEPGAGTTVHVLLPASDVSPKEDAEGTPSTSSPPARGSILVVDDDDSVRAVVARMLTAGGYSVLPAVDANDARKKYADEGHRVDLVIADVIMPDTSGKDLVGQLTEPGHPVRAIYMSGYTNDIIATRGVIAEGETFLQKPFTAAELLTKVRSTLAGPKKNGALAQDLPPDRVA